MKELSGQRFGRLLAVKKTGNRISGCIAWECICDCGNIVEIPSGYLSKGTTKSCGCYRSYLQKSRAIHGHSSGGKLSPTYSSWRSMHYRCGPNSKHTRYYADRGIAVCERWNSFENFLSDMGARPAARTLDRIDNSKGYEPGNCRWASYKTQGNNRSSTINVHHDGETLSLSQWSDRLSIKRDTLLYRYKSGDRPPLLFRPVDTRFRPSKR